MEVYWWKAAASGRETEIDVLCCRLGCVSGLLKNWFGFGLEAFQILVSRVGSVLEGVISEELLCKMELV